VSNTIIANLGGTIGHHAITTIIFDVAGTSRITLTNRLPVLTVAKIADITWIGESGRPETITTVGGTIITAPTVTGYSVCTTAKTNMLIGIGTAVVASFSTFFDTITAGDTGLLQTTGGNITVSNALSAGIAVAVAGSADITLLSTGDLTVTTNLRHQSRTGGIAFIDSRTIGRTVITEFILTSIIWGLFLRITTIGGIA
jgi:hypothetical protein